MRRTTWLLWAIPLQKTFFGGSSPIAWLQPSNLRTIARTKLWPTCCLASYWYIHVESTAPHIFNKGGGKWSSLGMTTSQHDHSCQLHLLFKNNVTSCALPLHALQYVISLSLPHSTVRDSSAKSLLLVKARDFLWCQS